ncbi:hypothetical protein DSM112329_02501 [Paraconexibacter sp. AEG42_29]|uniref:WGR domain-containing protein n=1 Tax=Paraconexibacter sp. AEG42_29 TaxID=2997339 RepID=A0AAU7AVC1_9ACTN
MRRFEYVGGTSAKFWEIEQDGAELRIRFGRMETAGQTQVKDLGTAEKATAQAEKLVAAKVGKGYIEQATDPSTPAPTAAGPVPATAAAPAAPPAPAASSAPAVPAPVTPPPAPATPSEPAAPPPATPAPAARDEPPELPDEETFALPSAWARQAEPFRGRRAAKPVELDPAPDDLLVRLDKAVAEVLENPKTDADLRERTELHLGTRRTGVLRRRAEQADDVLGAAVMLLARPAVADWRQREVLARSADNLIAAHGLAFAAEACALTGSVAVEWTTGVGAYGHGDGKWLQRADPANPRTWVTRDILQRMRAHLASTDEATYDDAVARLAAVRAGAGAGVRLLTSYLAPTEQQWVDEDLADAQQPSSDDAALRLASVTTAAQAGAILDATSRWEVLRHAELVYSLVANLGPDAAAPIARLLDPNLDAATIKRLLGLLAQLPTDDALTALLDRQDEKYVSAALIEAMRRYPVRALRLLAGRATDGGGSARAGGDLLRGHLLSHPGLADRLTDAQLGPAARAAVDALRSEAVGTVADPARLPAVLVAPPWTTRTKRAKPVVVPGLAATAPVALRWAPGEQQQHASTRIHEWHRTDDLATAMRGSYAALHILAAAKPRHARPYLATWAPTDVYDGLVPLQRILAQHEDEAIPLVLRTVARQPSSLAAALLPLEGPPVAALMAEWLVRTKSVRPIARAWLARHPAAAARDLVPAALGKPGKERAAAETALRVLDGAGHRDAIRAAGASHGEAALTGVDALLAADPLERLPAKVPSLPGWLDPAHLPQVLLRERDAVLPVAATGHVCTMLALSAPGDTYAGVEVVRDACDAASVAEMAWGLFERWEQAGFPAKDGWVLEGLGLLGDDETVRRLAPKIRAWPGDGGHARAVAGLGVLAEVGTDVALMHLHGIAEKVKFKGLRTKAQERMAEVADGLGLTPEQLADRLVPEFGLDRDGTLVLDYGPRRFLVGFDEQLRPTVADADGTRRKTLPRPGAKDDEALASAAYASFRGLKKDVKTIATDQIRRFERAMVAGRRWTAEEQRTLFVEHPLLWHVARRLVWATFDDGGAPTGSFRVAEDRTLADSADEELVLDDATRVGIAHPLHLGPALGTWSDVFADYEILQPFPQLGRETYALTDVERTGRTVRRLDGLSIDTGRVLGLSHRGWERGMAQDAGISGVVQKPLADGNWLVMNLDPGLIAGAAMEWDKQKIPEIWISPESVDWGESKGRLRFDTLDAVTASELLRDVEHLRG